MHSDFYKNNPFRPPQWRAERVIQLLTHQPSPLLPRRYDDRYVRVYCRFLMSNLMAGDDEIMAEATIATLNGHVNGYHGSLGLNGEVGHDAKPITTAPVFEQPVAPPTSAMAEATVPTPTVSTPAEAVPGRDTTVAHPAGATNNSIAAEKSKSGELLDRPTDVAVRPVAALPAQGTLERLGQLRQPGVLSRQHPRTF